MKKPAKKPVSKPRIDKPKAPAKAVKKVDDKVGDFNRRKKLY